MNKFILVQFLVLSISAFSQPQGTMGGGAGMPAEAVITGKVIDASSLQAIEYAQVSILKMNDSTMVTGIVTDTAGRFKLDKLNYGRYMIDVSFMGFKKTRIRGIMLKPDSKTVNIGDIKLEPENIAIGEVQVTGQRTNVEYKIDKKVVNVGSNLMATGATVVEALENIPSIQTTVEGDVTLRGSSNFVVLIDGKPSQITGSDALKLLPASTVDKIEIITNPSAKYEAEGGAGIINVIMKKNISTGLNGIVNISGGSTFRDMEQTSYSGDFTLNMRQKKFNYFISGDYRDGKDFADVITKQTTARNNITRILESDGTGFMARGGASIRGGVDYNFTDNQTISLSAGYDERKFRRDFGGDYIYNYFDTNQSKIGIDSFYTIDNNNRRNFGNYRMNLDYQLKINEQQQISFNSFYGNSFSSALSPTNQQLTDSNGNELINGSKKTKIEEKSEGQILQAKTDYTFNINEKIKLEAGLFANLNESVADNTDSKYENSIWAVTESTNYTFNDNIYAGYITFAHTTPWFSYQLGIRDEFSNRTLSIKNDTSFVKKPNFFFPTAHISKQLPWNVEFQLSYSSRISRPRPWDLMPTEMRIDKENIRKGNPDLDPELTNAYELSIRKSFMSVAFVSLEMFRKSTKDVIDRNQVWNDSLKVFYHIAQNIKANRNTGAEFTLNMPLAKWFIINGSSSFYLNEILDNRVIKGNEESYQWDARISSVFRLKTKTQIQFTYIYKSEEKELSGYEYPNHITMMAVKQEVGKKVSLSLQVRDLFQTGIRGSKTWGPEFTSERKFSMISPVVSLTLTYKLNNYQKKENGQNREEMNQVDFGM